MDRMRLLYVATKARELKARHGWRQDAYGSPEEAKCAIGLLRQAAFGHPHRSHCHDEHDRLILAAAVSAAGIPDRLHIWNDAYERRADDIDDMFDAMASCALEGLTCDEATTYVRSATKPDRR